MPRQAKFPDVPTLVLAGDLDSLTSPEGARAVADAFPDSTYVEVANMTHVTALVDFDQCASRIVRRFVRLAYAGDTSCPGDYHENRLVDRFVRTAAQTGWGGTRRHTARVAAATVANVMARWLSMYGSSGVGLQGGRFRTRGGYFASDHWEVRWQLHQARWVRDVAESGNLQLHRRSGMVRAQVRVTGSGGLSGHLTLRWDDQQRQPTADVAGRLGGEHVRLRFPAP